jgi:hypothetical protein
VVVLEDVHWATPTLLDLVIPGRLVGPVPSSVCPAGSGRASSRLAQSTTEADRLRRAARTGRGGVAAQRVVTDPRPGANHQGSRGNPLFLEQMVAMLADDPEDLSAILIPPP